VRTIARLAGESTLAARGCGCSLTDHLPQYSGLRPVFDIRNSGGYDNAMVTITRRTFLQTSLAAAAASAIPGSAIAQRKLGPIGLQLYSVRELMKADFAGTLQKVAAIGSRRSSSPALEQSPKTRALLDKID
jgi:hypothetical protein